MYYDDARNFGWIYIIGAAYVDDRAGGGCAFMVYIWVLGLWVFAGLDSVYILVSILYGVEGTAVAG